MLILENNKGIDFESKVLENVRTAVKKTPLEVLYSVKTTYLAIFVLSFKK